MELDCAASAGGIVRFEGPAPVAMAAGRVHGLLAVERAGAELPTAPEAGRLASSAKEAEEAEEGWLPASDANAWCTCTAVSMVG